MSSRAPRTADTPPLDTAVFDTHESEVRAYCRSFPAVFTCGRGVELFDEQGRRYLDFFAGAGALNYGHNPPAMRDLLVEHLLADGVTHALDMHTAAKRRFIERFHGVILKPRRLDYKLQFCGPSGTNAVEAALKLARRITGRTNICAFSGGWHGMSQGSLSVTSNRDHRAAAATPLGQVTFLPYPDGPHPCPDALQHFARLLDDPSSGVDTPAACIVEAVQCEGGIYVAPPAFLAGLADLCRHHGILLIMDEVQAGCGRTGPFFSFEPAGIVPDLVCLSKSIGGCGLPMALLLLRPDLDVWRPGEHSGTFRGNQLAFVAGAAAMEYWLDDTLSHETRRKGTLLRARLSDALSAIHPRAAVRGVGLLNGVDIAQAGGATVAALVAARCFERGLLLERCGRGDTVLKLMPPLIVTDQQLLEGTEILVAALAREISA